MYQYTRERLALILCAAILIGLIAQPFSLVCYFGLALRVPLPDWWSNLREINTGLSLIYYILYFGILMIKVDYIYRLPFDVHMVLVCYRSSGLPVFTVRFKTKKPARVDPDLLSGLFTALNQMFQEVGREDISLENVAGPGMHFLLEWGENVVTLVVTDQDTFYLRQAVKQFTTDFETCYAQEVKACTPEVSAYDQASKLIKQNFPFITIEEKSTANPIDLDA
jgi:hypothetical protein